METLKKNVTILHTIITLIIGWTIWWILSDFFPENYFSWYPLIPTFFYLMGMISIIVIARKTKRSQLSIVNIYMLLKLSKLVLSFLVIGFYFVFIKENKQTFAIVFGGYYLIYLGLETYFLYSAEKILKNNDLNE
ncbi:MAG: hypothetical protein GZ091_14350 [Paludibacter sp.]|nr:hypothetical protein [Paludibacter sp.]